MILKYELNVDDLEVGLKVKGLIQLIVLYNIECICSNTGSSGLF